MKHKIISVVIVAFVAAALLRTFIIEGFIVSGDSMAPTILSGDYVFVNKLAYLFKEPERGDVVVAYPRDMRVKVLKRVVGLPGERFSIEEGKVTLRVERLDPGTVLEEEYLESKNTEANGFTFIKLDPQEYFALGDNRSTSLDSRQLGPVDKWEIKGRVSFVFSFKRFKYIGL